MATVIVSLKEAKAISRGIDSTATAPAVLPMRLSRQQWQDELHSAAYHGVTEAIVVVLSQGLISIDKGDPAGRTALMHAAQEGHSRVARILLNRGANVSIVADREVTALHLSVQNWTQGTVKVAHRFIWLRSKGTQR